MLKKCTVLFLALVLAAGCLTACSGSGESSEGSSSSVTSGSQTSEEKTSGSSSESKSDSSSSDSSASADYSADHFADGDFKDVSGEQANAEITLSGSSATLSDTTRGSVSNGTVTITSKGIYRVTGSGENLSIVINDDSKSGNIYLILDGVTMTNAETPCIEAESCDKLIIQSVGENHLTFNNSNSSAKQDAAIYAKDDITVNGSGTLTIDSKQHGIVCKNDCRITGSSLTINADSIGVQISDSLRIGGGTISITSGHDGIQASNKDNSAYFYLEKADVTVNACYDGISVKADDDNAAFSGYVTLESGSLNITAGGGSDHSKNSDTSQKGIKTDGKITVNDTKLQISAADDAIHGNADIVIQSGEVSVSSSDDGITASGDLTINGGTVNVTKSYEGLEGANITINEGTVKVVSSDDGVNTSGGSDSQSTNDEPWNNTSSDAKLTINGGNVYVNASGDGLDSNGSIYITGGTVIVEGPTDGGNGAIDKGDGNGCVASITGGTVLAIGSTGMAVNFDSGTQCSALVNLSGSSGDTVTIDDGSGFSFTATKSFACVVYSSPSLTEGKSYTITAGSSTAAADFTSGLYYSDVATMGGGPGGMR